MAFRVIEIFATILLNVIQYAYSDNVLFCNVTSIDPCPGSYQICNNTQCVCMRGYVRTGDDCEAAGEDSGSGHGATAAVVTIFTLALLTCGLVLVVRKYNLIDYIQKKINMRRNNDIIYEDVMIGQDDPPLSP